MKPTQFNGLFLILIGCSLISGIIAHYGVENVQVSGNLVIAALTLIFGFAIGNCK